MCSKQYFDQSCLWYHAKPDMLRRLLVYAAVCDEVSLLSYCKRHAGTAKVASVATFGVVGGKNGKKDHKEGYKTPVVRFHLFCCGSSTCCKRSSNFFAFICCMSARIDT